MVSLESAELFRCLRSEELRALGSVALERKFAPGEQIFREGDPGDGVYIVKDGLVEISALLNPDHPETRQVFSEVKPGALFGEMAVIEHRPRSATATATRATTAWFIPRGEMLHLIERSPGLALSVLQVVSQRLREFNQHHLREVVQAEQLAIIGRFARSIVHDLKNPLNIIGITAEVACLPDAGPELRAQGRDRIRRQVERISELISEILYFTQGSREGVVLVPMDYYSFVRQVVDELKPEGELKSVRVETANLPPAVKVSLDPKRLRRVFFNLAHNAYDVMPEGGTLTLRFGLHAREVVTEVEDTGPGIAPEIADRLFQAFATHGKEHGTGLGLSICKKIIEDHGGRIAARSEPGRGAVFSFSLPLAK